MKKLAWVALLFGAVAFGYQSDDKKPEQPTLETISWLAGQWQQQGERNLTEELWMPARGRMMLGLNRTSNDPNRTGNFEYLRIVQKKGNVTYYASPGSGKATGFELTEADDTHAVFENPEHAFPQRIESTLDGKTLTASIAGDEPGPSWTFTRVGDTR